MIKWLYILGTFAVALHMKAQKPVVSLEANLKTLEPGDEIILTVKSNVNGEIKLGVPEEFIMGAGSVQGMNTEMDHNTGKVITFQYYSQNGAFTEPGTYKLYAFINNGRAIYKSNALNIKVVKKGHMEDEISERVYRQPVFGLIQASKKKIYEGEVLLLESKIYSRIKKIELESYGSYEIDGKAEAYELDVSKMPVRSNENFKGADLYCLSRGKRLYFVSSPGKYRIKPFEALLRYEQNYDINRFFLTSLAAYIEVIPLPDGAPADFVGLVGQYTLKSSLNKQEAKKGDIIQLSIEIAGKGNLHNIRQPKIQLPNGVILYSDPEKKEEVEFGPYGAEGRVTYVYHLELKQSGSIKMPDIHCSYFDPEEKRYRTLRKSGLQIAVDSPQQFADMATNANDLASTENQHIDYLNEQQPERKWFESKWFWPVAVSPLLLAFVGGIFWKRRKEHFTVLEDRMNKKQAVGQLKMGLTHLKSSVLSTAEKYAAIEQLLRKTAWIFVPMTEVLPSRDETLQILREHGVQQAELDRIKAIINACEESRYTVFEQQLDPVTLIHETEEIINSLS